MNEKAMELLQTIARVKRGTRNTDVVAVCEALEDLLLVKPVSAPEQVRLRFDKKAYQKRYMRAYMAKRRAEARRPKGVT